MPPIAEEDVTLRIKAKDETIAAFKSIEQNSKKLGENFNKFASVGQYLGHSVEGIKGLGKAGEIASASMNTLGMSMSVLGGPAGILLGVTAGVAAWVLTTKEATYHTEEWQKRLATMQGNMLQVKQMDISEELRKANERYKELAESLNGSGGAWYQRMKEEGPKIRAEMESLTNLMAALGAEFGRVQGLRDKGFKTEGDADKQQSEFEKNRQEGLKIIEAEKQKWAGRWDVMSVALMSEEERMTKYYEDMRKTALANYQIDNKKWKECEEAITKINKEESEKRNKIAEAERKAKLAITTNMFDNLGALMSSDSRNLFEIGKVAAIASATIKGYEATVGAYAEGTKIGGPILGAVYATTAAIATAAQIANIQRTQFGGGGTVNPPGGGAPGAAPLPTPPALGGSQNINVVVRVEGNLAQLVTNAQADAKQYDTLPV